MKALRTAEIIPNRLYWYCGREFPSDQNIHCFSIDEVISIQRLVYLPYNYDFGPLDLSMIYKYCETLNNLLSNVNPESLIYHCTGISGEKRSNSALLMGAYQILMLGRSAEESWNPFSSLKFHAFRDAGRSDDHFELSILDCLKALEKAKKLSWFSFESFNCNEYDKYNNEKNGGFNWIVPNKFLAFANPISRVHQRGLTAEQYSAIFREIGITTIIRLNNSTYDSKSFTRRGLSFYDLYFHDGSIPSDEIVERFLEISEKEPSIAIHCQAGLGRTGTLIGCYAIKKYDFNGNEFIAWSRMCRPGSVLGPQQEFLCEFYNKVSGKTPKNHQKSIFEKFKAEFGDIGQGAGLNGNRKDRNSRPKSFTADYKTKFNQNIKIDPLLLKLYGKDNK